MQFLLHISLQAIRREESTSMARKRHIPEFPLRIESQRFGVLRLEQLSLCNDEILRYYEPSGQISFKCERVQTDPGGVTFAIWPPETGVPDVRAFVRTVEERWDAIMGHLGTILDAAIPKIEEAIEWFWQIPDERGPTASDILRTGHLRRLNLNTGPGSHVLYIYDAGDLIGGHDLVLELDPQFRPQSAHFDG